MHWEKRGRIFDPGAVPGWPYTHASSPFPEVLGTGVLRIWFTCRTADQRSRIAYAEFDPTNGFRPIGAPAAPVIVPGSAGLFDDSGCAMGCIVHHAGQRHLFYLGWNLKVTVPWMNTIGLAIAPAGSSRFVKHGRTPIMDRHEVDPFSISYPFILEEDGRFRMWYGSNLGWGSDQADMRHVIKYAESDDLMHWQRTGEIHVGLEHSGEYAVARPWVVRWPDGTYRMWYSFRCVGGTYRLGMATSPDGCVWTRQDGEVGIGVSMDGWDSGMICYAAIFGLAGEWYMIYNGNDYGRSGFGLAELK